MPHLRRNGRPTVTEPKVAIQQRYFTNCINPIISKNLNPTMQFVQDCYNDRQDRYVEHRDNINFPIRLYGYEMESAGLCFGKGEAGGSKLTLRFRVRPKPYAFEGANSGVSEEACAAIARDMKIAVFHWPPLAPVVRRDKFTPETAAAKLIDYWLNNNNPKPVDSTLWTAAITVHLGRFARHIYKLHWDMVSCTLSLEGPEK
jgi:hypothetical protein